MEKNHFRVDIDIKEQKIFVSLTTDKYNNSICSDLFREMVFKCKLSTSDFSVVPKSDLKVSINSDEKGVDSTKLSKYDRIKKQKKAQDTTQTNSYKFFFVENLKDVEFVKMMEYYIDLKKVEEKEEDSKAARLRKRQQLNQERED